MNRLGPCVGVGVVEMVVYVLVLVLGAVAYVDVVTIVVLGL